jgi:hypothetical protein
MEVFTSTTTYETETCCNCGVSFAITQRMKQELLKSHKSFFCPNGHSQYYPGTNEVEKLKNLLRIESEYKDEYRKERDELKKSLTATKGHSTRLRKCVANGVCPCCNRTFGNLANHMKTEHPTFSKSEA